MRLDASALLAYLTDEPGTDAVLNIISGQHCQVSSVTFTELEGKLMGRGQFTHGQVHERCTKLSSLFTEVPLDAACRERAVFCYARKSPHHLSLGDAVCLGTAEALGMDVLTAERGWQAIPDLPIKVEPIR